MWNRLNLPFFFFFKITVIFEKTNCNRFCTDLEKHRKCKESSTFCLNFSTPLQFMSFLSSFYLFHLFVFFTLLFTSSRLGFQSISLPIFDRSKCIELIEVFVFTLQHSSSPNQIILNLRILRTIQTLEQSYLNQSAIFCECKFGDWIEIEKIMHQTNGIWRFCCVGNRIGIGMSDAVCANTQSGTKFGKEMRKKGNTAEIERKKSK